MMMQWHNIQINCIFYLHKQVQMRKNIATFLYKLIFTWIDTVTQLMCLQLFYYKWPQCHLFNGLLNKIRDKKLIKKLVCLII